MTYLGKSSSARDRVHILATPVGRLTPFTGSVSRVHLVEVEGLSYQEAGRILQVGRSNMKMIVFRSRKRIARRMRLAMNAALFRPLRELGAA